MCASFGRTFPVSVSALTGRADVLLLLEHQFLEYEATAGGRDLANGNPALYSTSERDLTWPTAETQDIH